MNIVYDTTYCFRGHSGIPYDANCLVDVLGRRDDTSLLIFPKTSLPPLKTPTFGRLVRDVGNAIRIEQGKTILPTKLRLLLGLIHALLSTSSLRVYKGDRFQHSIQLSFWNSNYNSSKIFVSRFSTEVRWARSQIRKPFTINKRVADIYIQQHIDPIRIKKNVFGIITLHDLIPVTHPHFFDDQAVKSFTHGLEVLAQQNLIWVVDTAANANELRQLVNPKGLITFIPCAITDDLFAREVSNKREKTVLMLSTIEPRKNQEMVVSSFLELKESGKIDSDWKLKILGTQGWQSKNLAEKLRNLARAGQIELLENPSRLQVVDELSRVRILISASAVEGFSLPPLEALTLGARILVSDIPQHRENLGNFAQYFSLLDPQSLKHSIIRALSENSLSSEEISIRKNYVAQNFGMHIFQSRWELLIKELRVLKDSKHFNIY